MEYLTIILFVVFLCVIYTTIIKPEKFTVVMNNKEVNDGLETSPKTIIENIGTDLNQSDYYIEEKAEDSPFKAYNNISYMQNADFTSDTFDKSGYFQTITRPLIPPSLQYL